MNQEIAMESGTAQQNANQKENEFVAAVVVASNNESDGKFMNTDCWNKIFDWLSVKDVISFGQTCNTFNWVAGNYFKWKYPAIIAWVDDIGIDIKRCDLTHFSQYIQCVRCHSKFDEHFISTCDSLKRMDLYNITLTRSNIKAIEKVLAKVEEIEMLNCIIEGHIYENFLKLCVNLKSLDIDRRNLIDCLPQKYPALQRLSFDPSIDQEFRNGELNTFFALNPNVRSLSMPEYGIRNNQRYFMESGIQLNDLTINWEFDLRYMIMLSELQERGFFKRLHIYAYPSPPKDQLTALQGLVTLYTEKNVDLPELPGLMELGFNADLTKLREAGLKVMEIPSTCINLRRLVINETSFVDILPFIRQSKYLNEISIRTLEENQLNLLTLNNERKKLIGAQKVTIYVSEEVYFATKWSTMDTKLELIDMERTDSYEDKQPHNFRHRLIF